MDIVIVVFVVIALIAISMYIYTDSSNVRLVVSHAGTEWIYPLSEAREIQIQGKLGLTIISISNNAARIDASPCENKICVTSKSISKVGEWSACLPNNIFIRIEGDDDAVDAIAQ